MRGAFALTRTAVVRSSPTGGVGELQLSSVHHDRLGMMGTVINLAAVLWRRVAALELEEAECRQVVSETPRSSSTVIDLTAAAWRRVAALESQVAECRRVVSQAPRSSWRHKVYTAELIEAERRLSIAEGMCRDERP
jgi:hypothetical protein